MPGIIEEITKTINEREKTDRIMSFYGYFAIIIVIFIIVLIASSSESSEGIILAVIFGIIFNIYIWNLLIKREEHFKRERKILDNLIRWFDGKIDESRISSLRNELRERENEEEEKNPIVWAILMFIPYVGFIPGLYVYYFLMKDFYRHDKREAFMLKYIHDAMENTGRVFLIPMKPTHQEIPKRNFLTYLVISIVTLGVFGIYWIYTFFRDPNVHFEYQKEWENRLRDSIQAPVITKMLPEPEISTKKGVPMKAELILPNRSIEITSDKHAFGRSDFKGDLSDEQLGYITNKEGERYHFIITKENSVFYIQDDLSTNGTKLNDTEIKGRGKKELKNDATIILAGINDFVITFKISEP